MTARMPKYTKDNPPPYKIVSMEEVTNAITEHPLAFDTESPGLYQEIRLAQFYQASWEEALLVENVKGFEIVLLEVFLRTKRPGTTVVMHNASYDISTIQDNNDGAKFTFSNFEDTLYLSRLTYPGQLSHSLDAVMTKVLGYDAYAELGISKPEMHKRDWSSPVLPEDQLQYSAIDVLHLLDVYHACKEQRSDISYRLDRKAQDKALMFQRNGLYVDRDRALAQFKGNQEKIAAIDVGGINVNSYQQVRPYIEEDQSDGLALATFALEGNERAANVRTARKLIKENSFIKKFLRTSEVTGRIYGKFAPSTKSGRFSCKDQNLQQLPRACKGLWSAPDGKVMIYADYPQLELRALAVVTKCPVLTQVYYDDGDVHDITATNFFSSNFTTKQRTISKYCNFNLTYGGGAPMLRNVLIKDAMLLVGLDEAKKFKRDWLNTYPGVKAWQNRRIKDFQRHVVGRTPFGRGYTARMMTDQMNIEIQGFGADVSKLAMNYFYDELADYPGTDLVNFVHDDFWIECPDDPSIYEPVAKLLGDSMQKAWFQACGMVDIRDLPMPINVRVGSNIGDIDYKDIFIHEYNTTGVES